MCVVPVFHFRHKTENDFLLLNSFTLEFLLSKISLEMLGFGSVPECFFYIICLITSFSHAHKRSAFLDYNHSAPMGLKIGILMKKR